jgi:hypothetical protein
MSRGWLCTRPCIPTWSFDQRERSWPCGVRARSPGGLRCTRDWCPLHEPAASCTTTQSKRQSRTERPNTTWRVRTVERSRDFQRAVRGGRIHPPGNPDGTCAVHQGRPVSAQGAQASGWVSTYLAKLVVDFENRDVRGHRSPSSHRTLSTSLPGWLSVFMVQTASSSRQVASN